MGSPPAPRGEKGTTGCSSRSVGTGAARPVTSPLLIGCQWHHVAVQLGVCSSASPFRGPPDLPQPGGPRGAAAQRARPSPPRGFPAQEQQQNGETSPLSRLRLCFGWVSEPGKGDSARRLSRGRRLVARQQELKQNSKKFVAEKRPEDWKMETICSVTTEAQLTPPMHITHGYATCMKRVHKQDRFLRRLLKSPPASIPLWTSMRDPTQSGTVPCLPSATAKLPLFQVNILLSRARSPLLNSDACNLIRKNVNFSSDFIKAESGSNLIFSPSWKILFYSTYNRRKIYLVYNKSLEK